MSFENKLKDLVVEEISRLKRLHPIKQAHGFAVVYESLCKAAGTSVAIGTNGHQETMSTLLDGMSNYMFEEAARMQKIAAALGGFHD
jgi:hypothetical protein